MKTKGNKKIICPYCKEEITELRFDVNADCSGYIDVYDINKEDVCKSSYDLDSLLTYVSFNNFCCYQCDEKICDTEEEAKEFLRTGKIKEVKG